MKMNHPESINYSADSHQALFLKLGTIYSYFLCDNNPEVHVSRNVQGLVFFSISDLFLRVIYQYLVEENVL